MYSVYSQPSSTGGSVSTIHRLEEACWLTSWTNVTRRGNMIDVDHRRMRGALFVQRMCSTGENLVICETHGQSSHTFRSEYGAGHHTQQQPRTQAQRQRRGT